MYLLIVAVILTVLKYIGIAPVADWSWWVIIGVYIATAVWWQVADASGYSKRKAVEKEEKIKQDRINKQRDRMRGVTEKRKK